MKSAASGNFVHWTVHTSPNVADFKYMLEISATTISTRALMLEYHCIGHGHEGCAKRARKNDVFCVKQHPFGRDGMCTVHNHYWVLHWVFGCNFFQSCSEISLFVKMNERISEIDTKYVALLHATTGSFAGSGRAVMDRAPWLYDLFMQWNARLPLLNYSNCGLAN